jgi:amino acid transporter
MILYLQSFPVATEEIKDVVNTVPKAVNYTMMTLFGFSTILITIVPTLPPYTRGLPKSLSPLVESTVSTLFGIGSWNTQFSAKIVHNLLQFLVMVPCQCTTAMCDLYASSRYIYSLSRGGFIPTQLSITCNDNQLPMDKEIPTYSFTSEVTSTKSRAKLFLGSKLGSSSFSASIIGANPSPLRAPRNAPEGPRPGNASHFSSRCLILSKKNLTNNSSLKPTPPDVTGSSEVIKVTFKPGESPKNLSYSTPNLQRNPPKIEVQESSILNLSSSFSESDLKGKSNLQQVSKMSRCPKKAVVAAGILSLLFNILVELIKISEHKQATGENDQIVDFAADNLLRMAVWFACWGYLVQLCAYIAIRLNMTTLERPSPSPTGIPGVIVSLVITLALCLIGPFFLPNPNIYILSLVVMGCFMATFFAYFQVYALPRLTNSPERLFIMYVIQGG